MGSTSGIIQKIAHSAESLPAAAFAPLPEEALSRRFQRCFLALSGLPCGWHCKELCSKTKWYVKLKRNRNVITLRRTDKIK